MKFLKSPRWFAVLVLYSLAAIADPSAYELAPIVKQGSASDVLLADPVLPSYQGGSAASAGSGGLEHSLSEKVPVVIQESGKPGVNSTIQGIGRSSAETNVQTLGIPLNGPQGGGFDFSTFPSFFWDRFEYQIGPSLGVFDPGAVAGALTLHPWTEAALTHEGPEISGRGTLFYSDAGLEQLSAAGRSKGHAAALVGYSMGKLKGPSGSFSGQKEFGRNRIRFHLLATDLDAVEQIGDTWSVDRKQTWRVVPVIQTDFELADDLLLKSTFFYDSLSIRSSPAAPGPYSIETVSRVKQVGTQSALLTGDWRFGLSAQHADYDSSVVGHYFQNAFSAQASRGFELGDWLIEPTARGSVVAGYSIAPEATLGVRRELVRKESAIFARLSFTRKFPNIVNRFYFRGPTYAGSTFLFPGFRGNPDLKPETDYTAILGAEYATPDRKGEASLQLLTQLRKDGQVQAPLDSQYDTLINSDTATIHAVLANAGYKPLDWLDLSEGVMLSRSHIGSSGKRFPYNPTWINVASARFHPASDDPVWASSLIGRLSSDRLGFSRPLPGYSYLDLRFEARLFRQADKSLSLTAGVENVFNRRIEIIEAIPLDGRIFTVSLNAEM